ncbi:MAG: sigma-70 family RNA polymerase sigma factor [Acidimicrobiia bacterium]
MTVPQVSTSIAATLDAPGAVRSWLSESLDLPSRSGAELRLVASELVTHVIRDRNGAGGLLEVAVAPVLGAIEVRVSRDGEVTGSNGQGIDEDLTVLLLDWVAQRWGERMEGDRAVAWAELRRPGARGDLSAASDEELLTRIPIDADARAEVVRRFWPMAQQISARYRGSGSDAEDLEQVAGVALMKAMNRFDPEAGRFEHYAAATISGELKRHLRDRCWSVRVPRGLQESVLEVSRVSRELSQQLGRTPDADDIARETGWEKPAVLDAIQAGGAFRSSSLDAPRSTDSDATIMDTLGGLDANLDLAEQWHAIAPALERLPERERSILHLRFYQDLTQSEIAEIVGVSQMHVSRLLNRALEKLRVLAG